MYLIIYAHPKTKGHCPMILEEVKKRLYDKKIKYEVIDLYDIKYDPVMHENEHYTVGNYEISKQNQEFQRKIQEAKHLIFIYPIWWGTMPAILKGFIDKVFTSRFAFKYVNNKSKGLLTGLDATILFTTGGPTWMYKLLMNPPGILMKYAILKFCGIKSKVYQLGNSKEFTAERIIKIQKLVKRAI